MNTVYIDFSTIGDFEDFYEQLKAKLTLSDHFGGNLDALYDSLSGEVSLPLHLELVNMTVDQLEDFEDLLSVLEEADEEVEGFSFSYYLEQYEDED
ncbi:barstar family protein [Bergeyella sp. RCAD1439]|uniref:barstar family protein n=1 Tax=Bergeyella anatis TaxID=3113737 RepID=UPI002E19D5AF|nr:barstar family protein [Bergeyella sp. RCAD1439]